MKQGCSPILPITVFLVSLIRRLTSTISVVLSLHPGCRAAFSRSYWYRLRVLRICDFLTMFASWSVAMLPPPDTKEIIFEDSFPIIVLNLFRHCCSEIRYIAEAPPETNNCSKSINSTRLCDRKQRSLQISATQHNHRTRVCNQLKGFARKKGS